MSASTAQLLAVVGGVPTVSVDVPICAVFLAIFVLLAAGHMTLFQINKRRGHKFIFSGLCFGFTMSRITACVFRLVWATRPGDSDISLVASVFLNAGILLVYIMNNFFAWRMVRSAHPSFGWNPIVRKLNAILLWGCIALIPLIVLIVLRVKEPRVAHIQRGATIMSRIAQTYFLVVAVSSAFLLAYAMTRPGQPKDPFGRHSWNGKAVVLALGITFACIQSGFRTGTTWAQAPLASNPAWWDSKAAFYCFNFAMDVCILFTYLVGRIDQRLHVPNGSNGPMSYSKSATETSLHSESTEKKDIEY
ncbi:hypothetical protein BCV69DRAFT_280887 [Microstroma glucosiphilum]|uniref:Uncharacterized protein n=1 Tax=Pseudomicrostroma glucosiphilum TaxID=1684307 RepID=A0A316UED9_9BASI|nr:hypothetical protein BCV69DRAFT_280887 [Pseudomicrostroma glucosiphilum]PWN23278.1 hypothetical protein BCV69DRAFT_280887 [Pseudomicrostroma glucosiphilum]